MLGTAVELLVLALVVRVLLGEVRVGRGGERGLLVLVLLLVVLLLLAFAPVAGGGRRLAGEAISFRGGIGLWYRGRLLVPVCDAGCSLSAGLSELEVAVIGEWLRAGFAVRKRHHVTFPAGGGYAYFLTKNFCR